MRTNGRLKYTPDFRQFELAAIWTTVCIVLLLLIANAPNTHLAAARLYESADVQVLASAMPHQGWAPMTVYFSAFGSRSSQGEIVKYEWDLDGNGLFDTDATAENGYASYTYLKPGQYTITLRVTDDQGGYAIDSLVVNVRHPASSPVDYWTVFDNTQLRRVQVSLTTQDWNRMWADIEAKVTVPADVVVFGERISNIGFRMRGQFSMRVSGDKKPWKFDIDAYVDGQEYHNLRQLMFINNIGDPSMMREILTYDMLRFAGVNASHACFVEFFIDLTDDDLPPIFWGVYTMIERVDRKFLASRFGRDYRHGNLYKASHAQRGPMDLIYYGPTIENFPTQNGMYAYGKTTNQSAADYTDIVNLTYVIDGVDYETPEDFAQALEQVFNVDAFLRYMAVMVSVSSWDIYPYTGNNYYLYNNPDTGQFEWIPWDLTWGDDVRFPLFQLQGEGLVSRAPLYDHIFEVDRYRWQYAAYLDLLARYWFNGDHIGQEAQRYYNLILPSLSQGTGDKMYYGETAMFSPEAFQDSWIPLANFARERSSYILQELAAFEASQGSP